MQEKLAHVCKSIKEKNPSLIAQICREVQRLRPYGTQLDTMEIKKARRKSGGASSVGGVKSNVSRTSARSKTSKRSAASLS